MKYLNILWITCRDFLLCFDYSAFVLDHLFVFVSYFMKKKMNAHL